MLCLLYLYFMKKACVSFFLITISFFDCGAAAVDTVSIYSAAMKKELRCVVITPDRYRVAVTDKKDTCFPVVYLLHGAGGDYSNWVKKVPAIKTFADAYQVIIVCPDGGSYSWYLDSPVDTSMKYETYISTEVPAYIDTHYATIKHRNGRAIAGLSMGGHGALFIAFRHAVFFGACGSMSGLTDLNAAGSKYELIKRIGDTLTHAQNWKKFSAINFTENYPEDSLAVIIDCGTEDAFFTINRMLHEKMLTLKIPHEYIERPGKHEWAYWANAVQYQLLFFRNFFDQSNL